MKKKFEFILNKYKKKILKYVISAMISIVFATMFTNIFIPVNTTRIAIEYDNPEVGGTLQLFYKHGEQNFSEEQSISDKISVNGRSILEIPENNIDTLRLDIDGISRISIKNIEIITMGHNHIIYSENWLDYCFMQNDMSVLEKDKDSVSYESTGSDSYLVFKVDERDANIEEYIRYLLLICISAMCCFAIIYFIVKHIEKEEKSQKENIYVYIKYVCVGLVLIQVVNIDYKVIETISERTETEYMVHIGNAESVPASANQVCRFVVHGMELLTQQFMIDSVENVSGSVKYQIIDENKNIIADTIKPLESVIKRYNTDWDILLIDCENLNLELGQEYEISMQIESETAINFIENSLGEMQQRQTMRFVHTKLYTLIVVVISIVLVVTLLLICRRSFTTNTFVVSAIILGIISCVVHTPCAADDEYRHFLRVYDIVSTDTAAYDSFEYTEAKGNVSVGLEGASLIEVPYELNGLRMTDVNYNYDNISYYAEINYQACLDEVIRLFFTNIDKNGLVSITATKSALFLGYIPQIIFAFLGKLFGMNAVGVYYLARIGNMLFAILMAYLCMRLLPDYKNIFMLLYYAPNAFWLSASCNRDSVVTALSMFCIAYIVYVKQKKKTINSKRVIFLILLFSVIAIIKLPYALLVALVLLLGEDNYSNITSSWKKRLMRIGMVGIIFAISVGSYAIVEHRESIKGILFRQIQLEDSVSSRDVNEEQSESHLSYALNHPQEIIRVIWERYKTILKVDIPQAINGVRYQFGDKYVWLSLIILFFTKKKFTKQEKLYSLFVFCIVWFAIIVVGYTWQAPDYGTIWGISPRYMLPILPILSMVLCFGNDTTDKVVHTVAPILILGFAVENIISMITVYY